jgi:hypothetical protein
MTRPKFANTSAPTSSRRPRVEDSENQEKEIPLEVDGRQAATVAPGTLPTIAEFMTQQMNSKAKEPTRPITLRFEETLWQKVEDMRGNLSKNDFFKVLVDYYDKSHTQNT